MKKLVAFLSRIIRRMNKVNTSSVYKQDEFISSLKFCSSNSCLSFNQYKCQNFLFGKIYFYSTSFVSIFVIPFYFVYLLIKGFLNKNSKFKQNEHKNLIILKEKISNDFIPSSLIKSYEDSNKTVGYYEGKMLSLKDASYLFNNIIMKYPLSPFFILKVMVKLSIYSYIIEQYTPKVICCVGSEFSFPSSFLTEYCNSHNIDHYNAMHGEMTYNIMNSYATFNRSYIWDTHYKNILNDLLSKTNKYIVEIPSSFFLKKNIVPKYEYTYYLQIHSSDELNIISNNLLDRFTSDIICIRFHPRTENVEEIYNTFSDFDIQSPFDVKMSESISLTKKLIGMSSTCLFQGYLNAKQVIIDDLSNPIIFKNLSDLRYIMLTNNHQLLSNIETKEKKMTEFIPSYSMYRRILKDILLTKKYLDYSDVNKETNEYVLLRHDVEFSVERAFDLSLIEDEFEIRSSYFFQLSNNAYNIFSKKNIDLIRDMDRRGHKIGLHFHCNGLTQREEIEKTILLEIGIFKEVLNIRVDRFSIHRPSEDILKMNIRLPGIINTYDERYFTLVNDIRKLTPKNVKYIADSKHKWNYGEPSYSTLKNAKRIQLLIHPYSWTTEGYSNLNNFQSLLLEKRNLFISIFEEETNHFKEIKNEI